jgi:uncharacterized protein (DUF924 family)
MLDAIKIDYSQIISFWFETSPGECNISKKKILWWGKDLNNDILIRKKFGFLFEPDSYIFRDYCKQWLTMGPEACLAAIILADQFPRHLFRNTHESYLHDPFALELCYYALRMKYDQYLHPAQRIFLYLPLEHSESIDEQKHSLEQFRKLYLECRGTENEELTREAFALSEGHFEIIKQFSRFPYRNKVLNRRNTSEEEKWLKEFNL